MKPGIGIPSAGRIRSSLAANRFVRSDYALLFSMIALAFVPSVNQLVVDRLVVGSGEDVLSIAGQIEWFDLFNETTLAFLTVPMYFVLNRARDDAELSKRIGTTLTVGLAAYSLVSAAIYLYASGLTAYMDAPPESVGYLRLETIGFVVGFMFSYVYVVLVVRAKWKMFATLVVVRVVMLAVCNAALIPGNGAIGIGLTNVSVNATMSAIALVLLYREGLLRKWSGLDHGAMRDWARTGFFSGGQVLVANLVYAMVVMRMVSDVEGMGSYWLANNFIWGWLIVPVAALGDKLRNEFYGGYRRIWNYLALTTLILVIWLLSVPLWGFFFRDVIGMENPGQVLDIVCKSVPFYVAYAYSVILQSVLISVGRTDYIFFECLLVNFVYYGVVYGLFLAGAFEASMDFAILMFGFGLVVCLAIDVILYSRSKKLIPEEYQKRDYDGGITQS